MEILDFLKSQKFEPTSNSFLSLPQSISNIEIGEKKEVKCIDASIAVKRSEFENVIGIIGKDKFLAFMKNPFDLDLVKLLHDKLSDNMKKWCYFIGKYQVDSQTFTYLLPRNFNESMSKCHIIRLADNSQNQKVFEITQ